MAFDTTNDGRALQRLLDELGRLPGGIGQKSAQRIAYHLLEVDSEGLAVLAPGFILEPNAGAFCLPVPATACDECDICLDSSRDRSKSAWSPSLRMSRQSSTGAFHGLYHVLGGVIAHGQDLSSSTCVSCCLADGHVTEDVHNIRTLREKQPQTYLSETINPPGVTVTDWQVDFL